MTIYLLANVGTRDVQLDTLEDIPAELIANPKTGQLKARPAGEFLLQKEQLQHFLPRIRLPMLEKALRFLALERWDDLRIILFATDQETHVPESYRSGDTIHFANLIREVLLIRNQAKGLAKKHIMIQRSNANPADYDSMHDFYRQELPTIARRTPAPSPAYLLIAGGTPQMNTMLLLIGTEVFGPDAIPLYVSQDFDRAHDLAITRTLYRQAFQRNLEILLDAYAYSSALKQLEENQRYLEKDMVLLLRAALAYGVSRRNLDLEAAITALDPIIADTRSLRGVIRSLQQEIADQSEEAKLRETIFLAQIAAAPSNANWSDFLNRLYRFAEGCLQLLSEREPLGVEWSDPANRKTYKARWWNANRALLASIGLAQPEAPAEAKSEDVARQVDRKKMRAIISALATQPAHESIRQALAALEVVEEPIALRNDIVHRFNPISKEEIEKKAGVAVETLIAAMRQTYQHAFGTIIPNESPYDTLNKVCRDILRGTR